jgi:hypothetical protein
MAYGDSDRPPNLPKAYAGTGRSSTQLLPQYHTPPPTPKPEPEPEPEPESPKPKWGTVKTIATVLAGTTALLAVPTGMLLGLKHYVHRDVDSYDESLYE